MTSIMIGIPARRLVGGVRDERQLAGALQRDLQLALPLGARAREAPRLDLAALRHELHQQPHVLVVDVVDLLRPELADATAAEAAPAAGRTPLSTLARLRRRAALRTMHITSHD